MIQKDVYYFKRINLREKKGLSPIIATTLLITMAIILSTIIFFWARGFITDSVEKFGRDIGQSCPDIVFSSEAIYTENKLYLENKGTVPIYGVEIRLKKLVGVNALGAEPFDNFGILAGETGNVTLPDELSPGDEITVVPILLGETADVKKPQACSDEFGVSVTVV